MFSVLLLTLSSGLKCSKQPKRWVQLLKMLCVIFKMSTSFVIHSTVSIIYLVQNGHIILLQLEVHANVWNGILDTPKLSLYQKFSWLPKKRLKYHLFRRYCSLQCGIKCFWKCIYFSRLLFLKITKSIQKMKMSFLHIFVASIQLLKRSCINTDIVQLYRMACACRYLG